MCRVCRAERGSEVLSCFLAFNLLVVAKRGRSGHAETEEKALIVVEMQDICLRFVFPG